jgi:hypothetical protein
MKNPLLHLPKAHGLYHPNNEKESCGVGFIAHIKGEPSHAITTGIVYWCIIKHTTTLINVNIMFYQNLNNVFITSFTGSIYSTMHVTIIVKQNLYNICMTIKTGMVYWCFIK